MKAAADSSVLIFFAKLRRLELLPKLFDELYVSSVVLGEILTGKGGVHEDAGYFEEFIKLGKLQIINEKHGKLSGEDATISLAKSTSVGFVLMDDYAGIKKAKLSGLNAYSCPFLLLLALKRGLVSKAEFDGLLDSLLSFNYFISPRLLREVIWASEKLS